MSVIDAINVAVAVSVLVIIVCRAVSDVFTDALNRPVYKAYATVVKISQGQDIVGRSHIDSYTHGHGRVYGSGFVSGNTYEQVVFETEDGQRLSFRMSLAENIYNVGDRGLLLYTVDFLGLNRFGYFRLVDDKYEEL